MLVAGLAALLVPTAEAAAQVLSTVKVRAGLGAQVRPEYPGADKLEWVPYPKLSVAFGDKPFGFGAPDDSFSVKLIGSNGFSAGPAADLRSGRAASDIEGFEKVGRTLEIGAYAQYDVSESIRLRSEVRKGIGGHQGLVGSLGADHVWRDDDKYMFSIGPRVRFSDGRFQRAFFGVTPEAAAVSGLAPYRPGGGIYAIGAISGLHYSLGNNWGLFGYGRYDRLIGDARNSPIVRDIGSPNQFSAGLGISHTFTIKL